MAQYIWRAKMRLPERFLTPRKVIARGKLNTCLIESEDGYRVTTSLNDVIKWKTLLNRRSRQSSTSRCQSAGIDSRVEVPVPAMGILTRMPEQFQGCSWLILEQPIVVQ
jgi:hypothetical protein